MRQRSYAVARRNHHALGMNLVCLTFLGLLGAACAMYWPDFRRYMRIKRM